MISSILIVLSIVFIPYFMIAATKKISWLNTLGSVFLCYFCGLILSFAFGAFDADLSIASDLTSVLVCIAMPLILFSANLPAIKHLAKPMLLSFFMNLFAVIIMAVAAFFLFDQLVAGADKISGMLIGTYTGGTPNMFAIGNGLGASSEQIILLQTADMISGGLYFFMLLSFLPRVLKKFLPAYQSVGMIQHSEVAEQYAKKLNDSGLLKRLIHHAGLFGAALVCVVIAMGLTLLIPSQFGNSGLSKLSEYTAVIMLLVTTFGILLSFVKKIRNAPGSYEMGQYMILMFSVAMGLCFDLSAVSGALLLLVMVMCVQFLTVILHAVFAKIGKIDAHTMMITSTAGVFGPAFIIPVAKVLKNDEIILPGILCGILGYAVGNYLGIGVGTLLGSLF